MSHVLFQAIFAVLGILYAVLLSCAVSFSYDEVLNERCRKWLSSKLWTIKFKSSLFFGISAVAFVFYQFKIFQLISLEDAIVRMIVGVIFAYSILYYVLTFVTLQRVRLQISDKILEEKRLLAQLSATKGQL